MEYIHIFFEQLRTCVSVIAWNDYCCSACIYSRFLNRMTENQYDRPGKEPDMVMSRRRFFHHSGAAVLSTALLTSCDGLLDKIIPDKKDTRDKTLAFFGDSLTIGSGGTVPYGTWVGKAFPERPVVNDGINGQIALSISIRQGGTPVTISVEGGKFDGLKELRLTKLSNEFLSTPINNDVYTRNGTVAGVKCTITRRTVPEVGEMYSIQPLVESIVEIPEGSVFELDEPAGLRTATQILWYGRNDIGRVTAEEDIFLAIANSIDYINSPRRFLVLGILLATPENKGTQNFNQVTAINNKLAARYGEAFVPMTPPTEAEMKAVGYTPSAEDQQDLENMNFPRGLRPANKSDEIHINDQGYQIVANRVIQKIKDLKY
jgi:lysophospholipase L1-like esterase